MDPTNVKVTNQGRAKGRGRKQRETLGKHCPQSSAVVQKLFVYVVDGSGSKVNASWGKKKEFFPEVQLLAEVFSLWSSVFFQVYSYCQMRQDEGSRGHEPRFANVFEANGPRG